MNSTPTPKAYPLQWPPGWPKTPPNEKEGGKFQSTLSNALSCLRDEVRRDCSKDIAQANYRRLALDRHPDHGGSSEAMALINAAWSEAKRERGW